NLLAAALESNPYDRSLRQIADKLDLASGSQPTSSRTAKTRRSQLETKSTLNPTQFSARLGEIEAQVGLIEILADNGKRQNTGFLIGPNIFMTTYHSVMDLPQSNIHKNVSLRFDYKESLDGRSITHGTVYQLAEKDWLIDYDEQLDYALLRIVGTPGLDPIGGERAELDAPGRGWMTIPVTPPVLSPGMPITILHYPEGGPLRLSI